jgi:prophage antirepressor-like protein|nr:MAG TPA: repressor domain protein [Caudoviricetes sp.]
MNELQTFTNPDFGEVRTLEENGEVLFCASDVAKALGYAKPENAISRHCRATLKRGTPISGKMQDINFIPEGDVYRLIARSKLPSAEQFERWVFDEVLPSIRKHGAYMTPETLQAAIMNPDIMIQLCQQLKAEQDKNTALRADNSKLAVERNIMAPKADYFDELVDRNLLTGIRETAKELGVKQKVFVDFLLDKKYLHRSKSGKLTPTAGKGDGLFEMKECFNEKTSWAGTQVMVTPKGRETFRLLCQGM